MDDAAQVANQPMWLDYIIKRIDLAFSHFIIHDHHIVIVQQGHSIETHQDLRDGYHILSTITNDTVEIIFFPINSRDLASIDIIFRTVDIQYGRQ